MPLLNNSYLLHWVADYEKSKKLIEEAGSVLKEVGMEINLLPKERVYTINAVEGLLPYESNEEKGKKVNKVEAKTREQLIARQVTKLYDLSNKKSKDKKHLIGDLNDNPILQSYSDKLSCLSIRTDILNYEVRIVVNGEFGWYEQSIEIEEKGYEVQCLSFNSHEMVFRVESDLVSGVVNFSSLGFGEGKFYEQKGVRAPNRSELLIILMRRTAQRVFRLSSME
jgi:hypothetical protein